MIQRFLSSNILLNYRAIPHRVIHINTVDPWTTQVNLRWSTYTQLIECTGVELVGTVKWYTNFPLLKGRHPLPPGLSKVNCTVKIHISITTRIPLLPFCCIPTDLQPWPLATTNLLFISVLLSFQECSIIGIICNWEELSFFYSAAYSGDSSRCACINCFFLFMAE